MNALREAELALANMQKHIALLGATDTEAKESLDLQLALMDDYMTACHDRFKETRRQVPAGKWTASKPTKPEEQIYVIGFAQFEDKHGVMDIKSFSGKSKLEPGTWMNHSNETSPRAMKDPAVDFGFDTGFKKSAFLPGNFFQLLFDIPINGTEAARFSQYRMQNRSPSLQGQRRFVDEERVKLEAECDKRVAEARALR